MVAISIEGPSDNETDSAQAPLEGEEVIDIAEYFGSEELSSARLVRYLQLKHSTRHAAESWTASGLESTLNGFSRRYSDIASLAGGDQILDRIQFCFVTNRPVSERVKDALADAADDRSPRHPGELVKLENYTGLRGPTLSAFCKRFKIEDCQDGYWDQRNILFQDVEGYLPDSDYDAPIRLKELVTRKALSESEATPTISKVDVLRVLQTDEGKLRPCPCLIARPSRVVNRAQTQELVEGIKRAGKRPVIIHAPGGVGKSVFSTQVQDLLPPGSVTILYDCFGNAQYRNAASPRHEHKRAFVQIANELAGYGLCHPLIPTSHADNSDYLRAFLHRLGQASSKIRGASPAAILCVIIDAADNAQMAAEEMGMPRSFAKDLLRETMPDGVRLVSLCRTHRLSLLDPPPDCLRLELSPFDRRESGELLHIHFPNASEMDVDEFHRLSSANPRVQDFVLSKGLNLYQVLSLLGPTPTSVDGAFAQILEDAISSLRHLESPIERASIDKLCTSLSILRPLVPITVLSEISGVSVAAIRSFAVDIGRPLILTGDSIQFADEPSETWFREKFKPSQQDLRLYIQRLKPLARSSPYLSTVIPQLLLEAEEFSELVDLALNSDALPETSSLEKRDIELQRLQFAIKASLRSKNYYDAARLALKAGGETAGASRRRELIQSNTDLASRFIDLELLQDIVTREDLGARWHGSHHLYEAGLLSGREELLGEARSRLRMTYDWLSSWCELTEDERRDEEVTNEDIAELALVERTLHGSKAAVDCLARWRPRRVTFEASRIVARRLIDHGRINAVHDLAANAGNNLPMQMAIICELREAGDHPAVEVVRRIFKSVSNPRFHFPPGGNWDAVGELAGFAATFVEYAIRLGVCSKEIGADLIAKYLPINTRGHLSRFSRSKSGVLRAFCLKAALEGKDINLADVAPPEIQSELAKNLKGFPTSDVQEYVRIIGNFLPWYKLRADVACGAVPKEQAISRLKEVLAAYAKGLQPYYDWRPDEDAEIAEIWGETLLLSDNLDDSTLADLLTWARGLKSPLTSTSLLFLARLGRLSERSRQASLELISLAYEQTIGAQMDATSSIESLIAISRTVLPISPEEAKSYFDEAMDKSTKVGDENLPRWDALIFLANRSAIHGCRRPEIAYRFARCAEFTYEFVAREKHFPWSQTAEALTDLCPSSSIAIFSRWRDRGFGRWYRMFESGIQRLLQKQTIDPLDALPLIAFDLGWEYSALLDPALASIRDPSLKAQTATWAIRYMKSSVTTEESLAKIQTLLREHSIESRELDSIISISKFALPTSDWVVDIAASDSAEPQQNDPLDWDLIFQGHDLATPQGVSSAYSAFSDIELGVRRNRGEFFKEAVQRIPAGQESRSIDAVARWPQLSKFQLQAYLEAIPVSWASRPAIRNSLLNLLSTYCRRECLSIARNHYYEVFPFKLSSSLANIEESAVHEFVLEALGATSESLDSDRLFSIVGLLAPFLSPEEALKGLSWGLELIEPLLPADIADGPWSPAISPPEGVANSLAGYIAAGLASPFAKIRWESAHSVLRMYALNRIDVLQEIFRLVEQPAIIPFSHAKFIHYRFHAVQWLLLATNRAAFEWPNSLKPFESNLIQYSTQGPPHALIRSTASRALLQLAQRGVLIIDPQMEETLLYQTVSRFPKRDPESEHEGDHQEETIEDITQAPKFYFGIDVSSYWYPPLARVFGIPNRDLESLALRSVRDELNFQGSGARAEDARYESNIYDYKMTSERQGSYPDADDLRFYNSYHAMMISAGHLLSTRAIVEEPEDELTDSFSSWLARHDITRNDCRWLADRRDFTPVTCMEWKGRKERLAEGCEVPISDYVEAIFEGEDSLNVWGNWTSVGKETNRSVHIRSALVSPKHGTALINTLATGKDGHDFWNLDAALREEFEDPEFVLQAWIEHPEQSLGIDEKDHWSGGIHFPPPLPSRKIIEALDLVQDQDLRWWRDRSGTVVMFSAVWGSYRDSYEEKECESGERLSITRKSLSELLKMLDLDLILQIEVWTRPQYRSYKSEDEAEKNHEASRSFLFRPDLTYTSR